MMFWLGSDDQGRDMLSAIFYGLRISLGVGTLATVCALAIGLVVGLIAAWFGGWVEAVIMRIVDLQLSFPSILIALVLLAVLGPGRRQDRDRAGHCAVGVLRAHRARRGAGRAHKEYIEAARLPRAADAAHLFRHLLPNVLPPLIVVATVQVAHAIALEATLSFLGLGMPITVAFAGPLDRERLYQHLMSGKYWISLYPGIALLSPSSASISSAISCATCSIRGCSVGHSHATNRGSTLTMAPSLVALDMHGPERRISSPRRASSRRSTM